MWCIIAKDGSVCTAHCTCMAGLGEVCSHVGAILFAADYANTRKIERSCTDVGAVWPMPSMTQKVPIVPVHEMNWGKSSGHQRASSSHDIGVPLTSEHEFADIMNMISELGYSCPLMRIVQPYATQLAQKESIVLPSVFNIFDPNNIQKSYPELMKMAKVLNISLSEEQVNSIEVATRKQSENNNWYIQRAGRITASKFKSVCKTNQCKPSLSLIKSICYPTKMIFHSKATSWGIHHENNAVEEYATSMKGENHEGFQLNEVGLIINSKWPQFGATPDRLVYCECCSRGCLEVKCPYLLYTNDVQDIHEYLRMKSSCLVAYDGIITLKKTHSYYYQIQMQLFISQSHYCDFVIWSPNIFFKERILPDVEMWERNLETAKHFHSQVIMPELMAKYFTSEEGAAELIHYCICNGVDDGRAMIKCDGDDCQIEWFHFDCVELVDTPDVPWYCDRCDE